MQPSHEARRLCDYFLFIVPHLSVRTRSLSLRFFFLANGKLLLSAHYMHCSSALSHLALIMIKYAPFLVNKNTRSCEQSAGISLLLNLMIQPGRGHGTRHLIWHAPSLDKTSHQNTSSREFVFFRICGHTCVAFLSHGIQIYETYVLNFSDKCAWFWRWQAQWRIKSTPLR